MGWQDVIGSVLTAGATGDPMAFQRNKLEQAFKQFQMQQGMEELQMRKTMHDLESQRVTELLRQAKVKEQRESQPLYPIFNSWNKIVKGEDLEEGEPQPTMADASILATLGQKTKPKYKQVMGTTAFINEEDPTQMVETGLAGKPEKPVNVPAWIDAMGVMKWGAKYHTPEGQKEFADYLATPKGQEEATKFQAQYAERGSPPIIIQTSEGFKKVNKGTNTATDIKEEGGGKVYQLPPSEVKTQHISLNDNIKSAQGVWDAYNKGLVGPVTGRVKQFGSKFFSDKEITTLKRRTAQLRTVIYGLSGKQINESEQVWLKEEILPELIQPSENFEVALKEFESWITRRKGLVEEAYPALKKGAEQPSNQAETKVSSTTDLTPAIQYLNKNKGKMSQKAMYDELIKKYSKDDIYKAWKMVTQQ